MRDGNDVLIDGHTVQIDDRVINPSTLGNHSSALQQVSIFDCRDTTKYLKIVWRWHVVHVLEFLLRQVTEAGRH